MPGDDINQILTADLLDKIGHKDEAAGDETVFQFLTKINSLIGPANPGAGDFTTIFRALKLISDYVDTLEAKIGLNTDGAGSGTLFARAAQIASYVDSVEASLATIASYTDTLETKLGANTDGAGTSTVFARLAQIAAYVDSLENGVSAIKSVQTGSATITASTSNPTTTVTISSVNTSKSIVLLNGSRHDGSSNVDQCSAVLTNGTTVTLSAHVTSGEPSVTVYFTVVEFN